MKARGTRTCFWLDINNRTTSAIAIIQFTPDNCDRRISILQAVIKLKIFSGRSTRFGGSKRSSLPLSPSPQPTSQGSRSFTFAVLRICSSNLFPFVSHLPFPSATYLRIPRAASDRHEDNFSTRSPRLSPQICSSRHFKFRSANELRHYERRILFIIDG